MRPGSATDEAAALREMSVRFYDAVNAIQRGDPAPMLALWSRADDATYCAPSGAMVHGWSALEGYWREAAARAAQAEPLMAAAQFVVMVLGDQLGYTVGVETVRRMDGSVLFVARATNVFRREAGGWRVVHRHADAAPFQPAAPPGTTR